MKVSANGEKWLESKTVLSSVANCLCLRTRTNQEHTVHTIWRWLLELHCICASVFVCVCVMGLHWIGHAIYNNCCNIGLFNVDLSWQKVSWLLYATTKVLDIGRHFIFSSVCIVCNLSRKKLKHTRNEKKLLTSLPDRVLNVLVEI